MENQDRIQAFLGRCRKVNVSVNAVCNRAGRNPNNLTRWRNRQNEPSPSRFEAYMTALEGALLEIERETLVYLSGALLQPELQNRINAALSTAAANGKAAA